MELVTQERVRFGIDPVVLVGEPRACMGIVVMHNSEKFPVKLRRLRLRVKESRLTACHEAEEIEIRLSVVLCAGETQYQRIKVSLPPGTPPGIYEASLEGAEGACCPVSIRVVESRRTVMSPPRFTCIAQPGASFPLHLSLSNLGNVPVVVPPHAAVELHSSDRDWPQHFHEAIKSHGDQGYEAFLNRFVKRMGDDEPPFGRAKVVLGAGPLAPQQGRPIEMSVSLPKTLRAGRTYLAVMGLAGALLSVNLQVTAADEAASAPG